MQRDPSVFLQDILVAAEKIEKYTQGLSYDDFLDNDLISDAVIKKHISNRRSSKTHSRQNETGIPTYRVEKDGWHEGYDDPRLFLH